MLHIAPDCTTNDLLHEVKGLIMALHDDIANCSQLVDAAIAKAKTDQEAADNVTALQAALDAANNTIASQTDAIANADAVKAQLDAANSELAASEQAASDLKAKLDALQPPAQ